MPGEHESRHELHQLIDTNKSAPMSLKMQSRGTMSRTDSPSIHSQPADDNLSSISAAETTGPGDRRYFGIDEHRPANVPERATVASPMTIVSTETSVPYGSFDPLPGWKVDPNAPQRLPPKGKKIYCSHWMSTGECDYAQQGCLYKHEMPMDVDLLQALGFQDIPKWYRDKHGIGKLTAVPGSGAHIRGPSQPNPLMQSRWRSDHNGLGLARAPAPTTNGRPSSQQQGQRRGPRPIPAPRAMRPTVNQTLLDLESRPPTPSAPAVTSSKDLLKSKFAPMQPASPTSRSSTTRPSSIDMTRSDTETSVSDASHTADNGDTPNTSVEDLVASLDIKGKVSEEKASSARAKWTTFAQHQASANSVLQQSINDRRRSSMATDYETQLTQQDEERDAREDAAYALSKAQAEGREQEGRSAGYGSLAEKTIPSPSSSASGSNKTTRVVCTQTRGRRGRARKLTSEDAE